MTKKQIKEMILDLLQHVDYDLYKGFLKESSEDWETAKEELDNLIKIAQKHINKAKPAIPRG